MTNIKMLFSKTTAALLIALLVLSLAGCGTATTSTAPAHYSVSKATGQTIDAAVKFTGIAAPEQSATATAQLSGTVANIFVKEGTMVKQGQLLASLNKQDLQVQLDQAKANLSRTEASLDQAKINYTTAEKDFQRYQELYNAGAISQKQYEQYSVQRDLAKSQYLAAQGSGIASAMQTIKATELNIAKMDIKSPVGGIIAAKNISIGENAVAGAPLFSIVSIDSITLTGNVTENMINYLKPGQPADVTVDALPGQTFHGKVSFVSPVSLATGQTFPVKITVPNTAHIIKAGMASSVSIPLAKKAKTAVPTAAIFESENKAYVYTVKDGKAFKQQVQMGLQGETYTEIIDGLKIGTPVVTGDIDKLSEGMTVK